MSDLLPDDGGRKSRRKKISLADPSAIDRLPPHSDEAEQGVLGCLMLDGQTGFNDGMAECVEHFRGKGPEVFYDLRHQEIFAVMLRKWDKREPVDLIILQEALKDGNQLENCGGLAYLSTLPDCVPSSANLSYYADIVFDKFVQRRLIQ